MSSHNAAGEYVGPLKRVHRPRGMRSLACELMRDGVLDVGLATGEVVSLHSGQRKVLAVQTNAKGYCYVTLNREKRPRRGRPNSEGRWRRRMSAWVHRLVMMKKLAVEKHGEAWREHVVDIDPHIDVDHRDRVRHNNAADNLRLALHNAHETTRELTPEELAAIEEFAA